MHNDGKKKKKRGKTKKKTNPHEMEYFQSYIDEME